MNHPLHSLRCPYCGGSLTKGGHYFVEKQPIQRYLCAECGRCNSAPSTPFTRQAMMLTAIRHCDILKAELKLRVSLATGWLQFSQTK